MRKQTEKRFPAYRGDEPYLVFCFSEADTRRVRGLMERMYARGTRLWHAAGRPRDLAERREREARLKGASLAVLYLTASAREDVDFKNAALYCQDCGTPLLCIDADEGDSGLSFGFTAPAQHIRAQNYRSAASLEAALVRCEGFSQELIGQERAASPHPLRAAALLLAALSALMLALTLLGGSLFGYFTPSVNRDDSVVIADAELRSAVRRAVGGGPITEQSLSSVKTLRLRELPADGEELALLTALERVEIPQSAAGEARWLLDAGYTVVLYGGKRA